MNNVGDFLSSLFMGASRPYRMGANILTQGYGPVANTLAGRDATEPGRLERYTRGGITPEEQQLLDQNPWKEMSKSVAGMGAAMLPFTGAAPSMAGAVGQGMAAGGMGGYGYSPEGKEVLSTLIGAGLGGGAGAFGHWVRGNMGYGGSDLSHKSDLSGFGQDSFNVKMSQGGDKALNAEAEMLTQVYNKLSPEQKARELPKVVQRLDEIIRTMKDPGQASQIEFLKKYLGLVPAFPFLRGDILK